MTLDSARSRRGTKPALFAMLDMAIIQSGVDTTADTVYALSSWSLDQGRRFPWYFTNEKLILKTEGGRDAAILQVAGAGLAMVEDHEGDVAEAIFQASTAWRNDLRRQWGDVGRHRDLWHVPTLFSELPVETDIDTFAEEWLDRYVREPIPVNQDEFDPDQLKDPRLRALWDRLSPEEREGMEYIAMGVDRKYAAELQGISRHGVSARLTRTKKKAKAMVATGPAT